MTQTIKKTVFWCGCEFDPAGVIYYDPPEGECEGGHNIADNHKFIYPNWMLEEINDIS